DFMGEHNSVDNVHSDFIDFEKLLTGIFDRNFKNIKNHKLGITQKEIREKHKSDNIETENEELDIELQNYEEIYDGISITNIIYGFNGNLTSSQKYLSH